MKRSRHIAGRMSQRGISRAMIELALAHGRCELDRYILDRREVDRRLDEIRRERSLLLKVRDKGGVIVVANDNTLITTYNCP